MLSSAKNTGISMGISSGANLVAIKKLSRLANEHNKKKLVFVTVFADGIDRYLSLLD